MDSQTLKRNFGMKKSMMWLAILAALLLAGCSASINPRTDTPAAGIRIAQMDTALGGVEGNSQEQIFSYHLTLLNAEPVVVVVHWIEPELTGEVSRRVLPGERRVVIEKTLVPNASMEVRGSFRFDAQGASKAQIASWEPFLSGATVSSNMTLSLPNQPGK
jgi:hypothetical protein